MATKGRQASVNQTDTNCSENTLDLIELKWQINSIFKLIKNYDTSPYSKSLRKCDNLKQLGNDALRNKKLHLALAYYNHDAERDAAERRGEEGETRSAVSHIEALKCCPNNTHLTSNGCKNDARVLQSNELFSYLIANRSLVLFQLEKYEDCLEQINLALDSGYPLQMRDKLKKRRTSCQAALEEVRAKSSKLNITTDREEDHRVKGKKNRARSDDVDVLRRDTSEISSRCHREVSTTVSNDDLSLEPSSNLSKDTSGSFVHSSLKTHRDTGKGGGRTVRTNSDLSESTLLLKERAYTWILHSKYFNDHCYHCLKEVSGPPLHPDDWDDEAENHLPECANTNSHLIPCFNCNQVIFCSPQCRNIAWEHFHSIECQYISLIEKVDDEMYSPFMTLRVILRERLPAVIDRLDMWSEKSVISSKKVTQVKEKVNVSRNDKSSRKKGEVSGHSSNYVTSDDGVSSSTVDCLQVVPLEEMSKLTYDNFCQLLYHPSAADAMCLEKASFILAFLLYRAEYPLPNTSGRRAFIGPMDQLTDQTSIHVLEHLHSFRSLLSEHIRRCQVNSMHITYRKLNYSSSNLPGSLTEYTPLLVEHKIGCGLFLSTAMINHSCDANSKCCKFNGIHLYVISSREITHNCDITISYGLFYKYHTLQYRQAELSNNYYFQCSCYACSNNFEPIFNAFKCTKCSGPVIEVDKCKGDSNACENITRRKSDDTCERGTRLQVLDTHIDGTDSSSIDRPPHGTSVDKKVPRNGDEKIDERKVHFNEKELNRLEESKARRNSNKSDKKILTCIQCKLSNHLQMKKLTNLLSEGNSLLSQALGIIYSDQSVDEQSLLHAVQYLIDAFNLLSGVLYKSHMQITIILEHICVIEKKLGNYREAIKYGKQLLAIVEENFDEDVNLFNNQFKLLDIYRKYLLQIRETNGHSSGQSSLNDVVISESHQLLNKFTKKLNTLLSNDSTEYNFYIKYIASLSQLLQFGDADDHTVR